MEEKCYTVYMHVCPNDKKYIGITKQQPEKRWMKGLGYQTNEYFYRAIKKYKWDNIKHIILFKNLSKEEAELKETEIIKEYKSDIREFGYNIEKGGHINCVSEETKNKISKTMKEKGIYKNNPNCFKKGSISWIKGKHHNEKTIKKIKEKRAKQKIICNKVLCVETNEKFSSAKEVELKYGFDAKSIRRVCSGERNKAYNYTWKYIEPKNRKNKKYY